MRNLFFTKEYFIYNTLGHLKMSTRKYFTQNDLVQNNSKDGFDCTGEGVTS